MNSLLWIKRVDGNNILHIEQESNLLKSMEPSTFVNDLEEFLSQLNITLVIQYITQGTQAKYILMALVDQ